MKKNLKFLALSALFCAVSANAFAAAVSTETNRNVNNVLYDLSVDGDKYNAQVVGISTAIGKGTTLTIPTTVTGGDGKTYKVTSFKEGWEGTLAAQIKTLTINSDNLASVPVAVAYAKFTALESLTIADANTAHKNLEFAGTVPATIKTVSLAAAYTKIAANAFKGAGLLTAIDLTNIKEIGDNAFDGCYSISSLTIPATVEKIGKDAFANMYYKKDAKTAAVGLQTLVFNANSDDKKGFTEIPAAFSGDQLLKSVTITSTKATSIAAKAFTGDNAIETIDLSGATALNTDVTTAFDSDLKLKSLKLYGTKLKKVSPSIASANRTLEEITFPAELTATDLPTFVDFVALQAIDLSTTKVTEIPASAFEITGIVETETGRQAKDAKGNFVYDDDGNPVFIAPVLASVKLNAATTKIGVKAFKGQSALATVENLNQDKLTDILAQAFYGTALTTVDLSETALTTITDRSFAECGSLTTVILSEDIEKIESYAFLHDTALTSINLEDTQIEELNNLFTDPYGWYSAPIEYDDVENAPAGLKTLVLPETLTDINSFALQGLGLETITIPSSVTYFGNYVLQGNVNLKEFIWEEAQVDALNQYTFTGDTKLEKVVFFTLSPISTVSGTATNGDGLTDNHFFMCNKDVLKVYVSAESYEVLVGRGYTPENSKYSTLVGDQTKEIEFKAKAADGYYYATYHTDNATWFPVDQFEVFTAVVEGDKVNLKAAEEFEGYYKVPANRNIVLRSTNEKGSVEIKGLYNNTNKNNSIEKLQNHLRYCNSDGAVKGSKINYIYKLGVKSGVVAFYRITSGEFKAGQIYINANSSMKARLDIVFDGEATAIDAVETVNEDAPIYNLQGVRVNNAQKGIYIQNGKKFVK